MFILKELCRALFRTQVLRRMVAVFCILSLVHGNSLLLTQSKQGDPQAAQSSNPQASQTSGEPAAQETAKLKPEELDSLVAPIALYPDPLLSQTLVASTYPLEVVQLKQWLEKNSGLKEKELTEAVKKQNWDPSIQALASLPDVVKRLSENIKWTSDLGNAFLAQQSDVMDAVQRMRKKAKDTGNLKSSDQQKVETKVVENKQVIIVEQAKPEVIYVPTYNPTVVYGPPVYPYPPVYYPPPGYYAAGMAISFGVGVAMGAAWGGGWGWNCGWGGHNNVYINNNNNFVRSYNSQNISNRTTRNGNTWQHNPQHRGGAPYSDRATARQYGGTARGESLANRQQTARQNQSLQSARQNGGGRTEQAAMRERTGSSARQSGTASTRSAGDPSNRPSGDRVGDRSVSSGSGSRSTSAFGSGGSSGASARSSSSRGASSMGASRGSRGGGGGRRR